MTAKQLDLARVNGEIEKLVESLTTAGATLVSYVNEKIEQLDAQRQTITREIAALILDTIPPAQMEADVAKGEEVTADFQLFLDNVRKYTDITELTPTIINEFISRIEIHAPGKLNGKRTQQIDIYYNSVGVINIPTSEELAAFEAEHRARKQQNHINA